MKFKYDEVDEYYFDRNYYKWLKNPLMKPFTYECYASAPLPITYYWVKRDSCDTMAYAMFCGDCIEKFEETNLDFSLGSMYET